MSIFFVSARKKGLIFTLNMFILVNHTTKDRSYEQLYLCESSGYDCKCY